MSDAGLSFRSYNDGDIPFIHDSWGSSYMDGRKDHKLISSDDFHSFHRPIREKFFKTPTATCIVCSPDDDPWLILGWIAVQQMTTGLILHYIYVKNAFKNQGIAKQLIKRSLPSSPVFYTHLTDRASKILAQKHGDYCAYKYVPHLV